MQQITQEQLEEVLPFPVLIDGLRAAFRHNITVPVRHQYDYPNPKQGVHSTLLLMPAWEAGAFLGVKIMTVSPLNGKYDLPAVQGVYLFFDAVKGLPLAQIEARTLTTLRTAAASALASTFLSRPESASLLMIGTGALAPHLIRAHASVRSLDRVFVWGRRHHRAAAIVDSLQPAPFHIEAIKTIEEVIREADIVSCATLSPTPLVYGDYLRPGQHLDLVGSFKPNMREADDEAVRRSSIFVDTRDSAPEESGDLAIPIQRRILTRGAIKADLFELCRGKHPGRKNDEEITFFKSVGHALEDLAAAKLAYEALAPGSF
jgi:alanine dehydrogenase